MKTIEDEMAELPLFKKATKMVIESDPHTPLERLAAGARFAVDQSDAFDSLRALPAGSVHMLNFDLPYESLEKHRSWGTTTRLRHSKKSSNDWFGVIKNERFPELFAECYRVLAKNAHCYCYCDDETSDIMKLAALTAGFKCWKRIVFDKIHFGLGYHYRGQYEFVLFLEKGKRRLNNLGVGDVLRFKRIKHKDAYPAEKPVELNEVFVLNSSNPGEIICDPFMGSGSAGVAAVKNGRKFLGSDISPAAVERAGKRLSEL